MTHRLHFPAPSRVWAQENGGWSSHRWGMLEVLDYKAAGGWFQKAKHEFASKEAAKAAGVNDDA